MNFLDARGKHQLNAVLNHSIDIIWFGVGESFLLQSMKLENYSRIKFGEGRLITEMSIGLEESPIGEGGIRVLLEGGDG